MLCNLHKYFQLFLEDVGEAIDSSFTLCLSNLKYGKKYIIVITNQCIIFSKYVPFLFLAYNTNPHRIRIGMFFQEFGIHLLFLTGKIDKGHQTRLEMAPEFLGKKRMTVEFFGNSLRIPVGKAAEFTFGT